MTYYQMERAVMCYLPQLLTQELKDRIDRNISLYDEFFTIKYNEESQEIFEFTTRLLFQEAQKNVNEADEYIDNVYGWDMTSLVLNALADERFKEGE